MKILGIDEAGRGSILGSMFVAGIVCSPQDNTFFKKIGVQDSKLFGSGEKARKSRFQIAEKLKKYPYFIQEASSKTIDNYVAKNGLNKLTRKMACQIIESFEVNQILLDGVNIFSSLKKIYPHSLAVNQGDKLHLSIAAASILAKNARDQSWQKISSFFQKKYGINIKGGGYANKSTIQFLTWYLKTYQKLPCFYRQSYQWKTFLKIKEKQL